VEVHYRFTIARSEHKGDKSKGKPYINVHKRGAACKYRSHTITTVYLSEQKTLQKEGLIVYKHALRRK
jgi:hypothetical protein